MHITGEPFSKLRIRFRYAGNDCTHHVAESFAGGLSPGIVGVVIFCSFSYAFIIECIRDLLFLLLFDFLYYHFFASRFACSVR